MEIRANGTYYDLGKIEEHEVTRLYKKWHKERPDLYCLCKGKNAPSPPKMHIMLRNNKLSIRNTQNNIENGRPHEFTCPNNVKGGIEPILKKKGIRINESHEINATLRKGRKQSKKQTNPTTKGVVREQKGIALSGERIESATLRSLFHTMLQLRNLHRYNPYNKRDLAKNLYQIACNTSINRKQLKGQTYLANEGFKLQPTHLFVFAWGKKNVPIVQDEKQSFLVHLPLFSLTNTNKEVSTMKVSKLLYEEALKSARQDVNEGYWIARRKQEVTDSGFTYPKVIDLIFVSAEPYTKIPVESSYEEQMIKHLVKMNRKFYKPLVGNVTELFLDLRPDMVLEDTSPKTIIEVAGMKDEVYRKRLKEKQQKYTERGYHYIEWDGDSPLSNLKLI